MLKNNHSYNLENNKPVCPRGYNFIRARLILIPLSYYCNKENINRQIALCNRYWSIIAKVSTKILLFSYEIVTLFCSM